MLLELTIRNLAVIEHVQVNCRHGFHVLTGETGAGKSIIIDALSLIAGGRGSADLVRYGSDKAVIEALFTVSENHPVWQVLAPLGIELDEDEHLIIRREITAQGKSTCRINNQLVNIAALKTAGQYLVNIHGQHEHQSLFRVEEHIHWLDLFGGASIHAVKKQYGEVYGQYIQLMTELRELEQTSQQTLQMMDLYRYQCEEIEAAKLKPGEEDALLEEKRKLANAERLYSSAADAYELLYGTGGSLSAVSRAVQKLSDIAGIDQQMLQPLLEQAQTAYYQLEDAAFQLRDYRDDIEFNPGRLNEIEQRLDAISTLKRKYGDSEEQILVYLQRIKKELDAVENKEERLAKLKKQEEEARKQASKLAEKLSMERHKAAEALASEIMNELKDLHMERTRFKAEITPLQDGKLSQDGSDEVEFMISANPGEPLKPLSKIASGGEISRVMLAMKTIFARLDQIPVLVFDEVDTGVSGRAAQAIAEKMSKLSSGCQVFSITHLPQVACMADTHYRIHKKTDSDRTYTHVDTLSDQGRIEELARMLGGVEVTDKTMQHAQEMLALADAKKQGHQ